MKTTVDENLDNYINIRERTLYVRLPHTIHNVDEVQKLFSINVEVKLLRQSSRNCHVVFSTVEEKIKNLKYIKQQVINGKRIFASELNNSFVKPKSMKKLNKKLIVPEPSSSQNIIPKLYICNINTKSSVDDLKRIFGDDSTVVLLNKVNKQNNTREAIVKLKNGKLATEYLKKEREWPCLHGNKLIIKPNKRNNRK